LGVDLGLGLGWLVVMDGEEEEINNPFFSENCLIRLDPA
jgi:hypothetical protein